jgi:hypothetical protein
MTAGLDAARLGRLDRDTRAVEVTGDDVAARVNELIHGLGVVPGMLPLAGEDDADRCLGLVWRAPIRNEFTLRRTAPNGMQATKPSLSVLVQRPAATPFT